MPVYHVWFATKRRLWLLQDEVLESVRELIFQIAAEKQIELLAHEAVVDHVQLLLRASDRTELATYMNLLKGCLGASSLPALS